jgi:uncharacterized protein
MQSPRVEHDERGRRYTLSAGTTVLSEITYSATGDTVCFEHTWTPVEHRGQGFAATLTRASLDDLRSRGLRLLPACPYTRAYLRRHPDQLDLVAGTGGDDESRSRSATVTSREQTG